MLLVGMSIILLSLAVVTLALCFIRGLRNIIIKCDNINITGIPSVNVPSVMGVAEYTKDTVGGGIQINNDLSPVIPDMSMIKNTKVETNMNITEKGLKKSNLNITKVAKSLRSALNKKGKEKK